MKLNEAIALLEKNLDRKPSLSERIALMPYQAEMAAAKAAVRVVIAAARRTA